MKTMVIVMAAVVSLVAVSAARNVESAGTARGGLSSQLSDAAVDPRGGTNVGDRYLVPDLPSSVVDQLPATERAGDRYLPQRIELAELVIGERILAAEDLAAIDARDLPGFTDVLLADGFRQDADGVWYYDRFASWMRFPLNR